MAKKRLCAVAAITLAAFVLGAAPAARADGAYAASDPALIAAAKKEGTLTLYSSMPQPDNVALSEAFTKKYGIAVTIWRGSSESVVQRAINESRAGRRDADVLMSSSSAIEAVYREKLLTELKSSPILDQLLPQALPAHHHYASFYFNVFAQTYNTTLVKKEDLPKTYKDLVDPKWKGKLGVEAEDYDWFAEAVKAMGEKEGLAVFRDIVAKNGISVRSGHTLLTNLVAAGEVPLALTVYSYSAAQAKMKGAPVDYFIVKPAIARPTSVGVMNNGPHQNAAQLFLEFSITDAQPLMVERQFTPTNKITPSDIDRSSLVVIDNAVLLDDAKKWQDLYADVFKGTVK